MAHNKINFQTEGKEGKERQREKRSNNSEKKLSILSTDYFRLFLVRQRTRSNQSYY